MGGWGTFCRTMHWQTIVFLRYSLHYFLQPVMRKTLLLKGLDLVRPCPGHESCTSEETGTATDTEQTKNLFSLWSAECEIFRLYLNQELIILHNANFIIFTVKVKLDLFISSLFKPFILKCDSNSISPNMDNTLSRNRWWEFREFKKSVEQCALSTMM